MENTSKRKRELKRKLFAVDDFSIDQTDTTKTYKDFDHASLDGLNEEQTKMVLDLQEYITTNKENKPFFLIQGGGGVGKSYSIRRAIEHLPAHNIIAAAPSHFAKNIISNFLGSEYTVTTVASLLGKILKNDKDGNQILVNNKIKTVPPIFNYDIIIIDEISMVPDDIAKEILNYTRNKKLILLGDYCQLPPVGQQQDSLFFDNISAKLVKPMRFTGLIYNLTQHIRKEINKLRGGLTANINIMNTSTDRIGRIDENGSGYIFMNNLRSMITVAVNKFKENDDINYARVIAFRNETIDKYNNLIRGMLYGSNPKQFETGELLISDGSYNIKKGIKISQIIPNGSVLKVIKTKDVIGPYNIKCKELFFENATFDVPIYTVANEGREDYEKVLKTYKKRAKKNNHWWNKYFTFKESFAHFKYSYAISTHKAQGSSIKYVFIAEDDILSIRPITIKEKLQSLYVGVSRAVFRVYIYNKKFKVDYSELNKEYLHKKPLS